MQGVFFQEGTAGNDLLGELYIEELTPATSRGSRLPYLGARDFLPITLIERPVLFEGGYARSARETTGTWRFTPEMRPIQRRPFLGALLGAGSFQLERTALFRTASVGDRERTSFIDSADSMLEDATREVLLPVRDLSTLWTPWSASFELATFVFELVLSTIQPIIQGVAEL